MSFKQSSQRQTKIEGLKKAIEAAIDSKLISDIILHEFPKWSLYYKDGDEAHSFNHDCFTNASIYKLLKTKL